MPHPERYLDLFSIICQPGGFGEKKFIKQNFKNFNEMR